MAKMTADQLNKEIYSYANLLALAIVEGAPLEQKEDGTITAKKEGKLHAYSVGEAAVLTITAVNSLIDAARNHKAEPFNKKNKKAQDFIVEHYGAKLDAIKQALAKEDTPAMIGAKDKDAKAQEAALAKRTSDALEALLDLSTGIAAFANQEDVNTAAQFPEIYVSSNPEELHPRQAYDAVNLYVRALRAQKNHFVGPSVALLLPAWQGVKKKELTLENRINSFNEYIDALEAFLERQDELLRAREGSGPPTKERVLDDDWVDTGALEMKVRGQQSTV